MLTPPSVKEFFILKSLAFLKSFLCMWCVSGNSRVLLNQRNCRQLFFTVAWNVGVKDGWHHEVWKGPSQITDDLLLRFIVGAVQDLMLFGLFHATWALFQVLFLVNGVRGRQISFRKLLQVFYILHLQVGLARKE